MSAGEDNYHVVRDGEKARIELSEKSLECCGTGTLLGLVYGSGTTFPTHITLVFPQKSLAWCQQHNGPNQWVLNEFVLRLLIDDILLLVKRGVQISTEVHEEY